jgi:hypothetical protein
MNTIEHSNYDAPRTWRVHPGHLSALAVLAGGAVLLFAPAESCADYTGKTVLNALIVLALLLQGAALVLAIVRAVQREQDALVGVAVSLVLSLLAVPGALFLLIVANGFLCD